MSSNFRGGAGGKTTSHRTIPEDIYQKLDSVLTRMLDKPIVPSTPELMSLDRRRQDLEELEEENPSALQKAKLKQAYDNYLREYQLYMGKQDPFSPAAPPSFFDKQDDDDKVNFIKTEKPSYIPKQTPKKKQKTKPSEVFNSEDFEDLEPGTSKPSKPRLPCTYCGETFKDKRGLTSHLYHRHDVTPSKKTKKRQDHSKKHKQREKERKGDKGSE